jgi:hypothetical protein
MRLFILGISFLMLCSGCGADYYGHMIFVSPDGSNIMDVVSEDQGANDPDPFWQHVSLRSVSVKKPVLPGNVLVCSCYSRPEVTWQDNKNATIKITGMVGQHFRLHPPPATIRLGAVNFLVKVESITFND